MNIITYLAERSQSPQFSRLPPVCTSALLSALASETLHSNKTNLGIGNRLEFRSRAIVSGRFPTVLRRPVSCLRVTVGSSGRVVAQANVSRRCVSLAERISSEVVDTAIAL